MIEKDRWIREAEAKHEALEQLDACRKTAKNYAAQAKERWDKITELEEQIVGLRKPISPLPLENSRKKIKELEEQVKKLNQELSKVNTDLEAANLYIKNLKYDRDEIRKNLEDKSNHYESMKKLSDARFEEISKLRKKLREIKEEESKRNKDLLEGFPMEGVPPSPDSYPYEKIPEGVRDMFKKFLNHHDCEEEWWSNRMDSLKRNCSFNCFPWDKMRPKDLTLNAFHWAIYTEKEHFWNEIDESWKLKLREAENENK